MIKPAAKYSFQEIDHAIQHLPLDEKVKLFRRLQKETWTRRLDDIMKTADRNRRKYGISSQTIR